VKKALLLIDIQNDYFKGGASELIGSDIAAENAKKLLLYFRAHHLPIVHIQHLSTRSGATGLEAGMKVTFYGRCEGTMLYVLMKNCKLVDNLKTLKAQQ